MKLSSLLQLHKESQVPEGLILNFGDSYLMQNNKLFGRIRRKALKLGFTFSDKPDVNYQAFPMGQLENILDRKTVPYTDNVTALESLNSAAVQIDWDHIVDNLKPNYIFHESCHAVARSLNSKNEPSSGSLPLKLTILLAEESFANTCEFLAIADAKDQTHRNFLEVNSYFTVFEERTKLIKLFEKAGAVKIFKAILLCYVHSNFLNDHITDSDFRKILELAELQNTDNAAALKSLAKNCFDLNPSFRYTTTEMYLRSHRIETPVEQALDFDYLDLIKHNEKLVTLFKELSEIAGDQDER